MTQAVNLANFANSLNTSGQLDPSNFSASVPVTKGGTGAALAVDARSNLGVDYPTIGQNLYPVGSIYINASVSTNPNTLLGFGTWVSFGSGRVLVGVDSTDSAFDTLGETGGSKDAIVVSHTHTASTNTTGAHTHGLSGGYIKNVGGAEGASGTARQIGYSTDSAGDHSHTVTVNSTGSSATNANLQPYITVYMWKRTA